MAINSVDSGSSSLINPNAKVHVATANDTESVSNQKTIEAQKNNLEQVLSGEADTVDISDEARMLSKAAQELAAKEAALEEEAENAEVIVKAEPEATDKASTPKVTTPSSEVYGKEERKATSDYYVSVLEDFRSQYSEEEAMRKFDDFMRSEGFELGPAKGAQMSSTIDWGRLNTPRATMGSMYSMGAGNLYNKYGLGQGGIGDSRLTLHSSIGVADLNGDYKIYAESTAQFFAYNSDATRNVVDKWSNQYAQQFAQQSGMDMDALRETLGWDSPYTAIAAADKDLGTRVMDVVGEAFKKAGVEFSGNEQISFSLTYDEAGNAVGITGNYFSTEWDLSSDEEFDKFLALQEDINKQLASAVAKDPSLLEDFAAMNASVPMADLDSLEGAFSDGDRGVSYNSSRNFVISASQPDTVVMADSLWVNQTGYTYHKKTDAFDPEADTVGLHLPHSFPGHENSTSDDMGAYGREAIEDAIANGTQVKSEVDKETYDANRGPGIPGLHIPGEIHPDVEMYDSRTGEVISGKKEEKVQDEEEDEEEEPEEENATSNTDATSTAYEERDAARRSAVESLLARARKSNDTRTVSLINNLMTSLNDFYTKNKASRE